MHRDEVFSIPIVIVQKEDNSNQALDCDAPRAARQRRVRAREAAQHLKNKEGP